MHLQIWGKVPKVQEEESMIISLLHKTMKKKVCIHINNILLRYGPNGVHGLSVLLLVVKAQELEVESVLIKMENARGNMMKKLIVSKLSAMCHVNGVNGVNGQDLQIIQHVVRQQGLESQIVLQWLVGDTRALDKQLRRRKVQIYLLQQPLGLIIIVYKTGEKIDLVLLVQEAVLKLQR